jgi:DNA-binding NtrC family response regulator
MTDTDLAAEVGAPTEGFLEDLIRGRSDAIRQLRAEIEAVPRFPTRNLLVVGETGVGKELVPRALQRILGGATPLEVFNCPAVPGDHLESELYGTARSAYPGATDRAGAAERANGGILFLDEIAAMPLAHQAKVLRFLESREGRRLGATRPYRVSTLVVTATNEDLASRVASGLFREDLYHRLVQDGALRVPPLRERPEDVAILAEAFLAELPGELVLSPAALDRLRSHDWPGNVRQLRAVLRCAARLAPGPRIDTEAVSEALRRIALPSRSPNHSAVSSQVPDDFAGAGDAPRRRLLIDALVRAGGNQTRAGLLLGLHRKRDDPGAVCAGIGGVETISLGARKLAHRKFRYWWDRLVEPEGEARGQGEGASFGSTTDSG